jgi:hypothetical protein
MFVEVLPKGVILCNTLIIKTIPYFIVEIYIYIYMMRVLHLLHLHFCYAIPLGQDKT